MTNIRRRPRITPVCSSLDDECQCYVVAAIPRLLKSVVLGRALESLTGDVGGSSTSNGRNGGGGGVGNLPLFWT